MSTSHDPTTTSSQNSTPVQLRSNHARHAEIHRSDCGAVTATTHGASTPSDATTTTTHTAVVVAEPDPLAFTIEFAAAAATTYGGMNTPKPSATSTGIRSRRPIHDGSSAPPPVRTRRRSAATTSTAPNPTLIHAEPVDVASLVESTIESAASVSAPTAAIATTRSPSRVSRSISGATAGMLGYSTRAEVAADIKRFEDANAPVEAKLVATPLANIAADPELANYTQNAGGAVFRTWCAQCHGAGAAGAKGFPNLLDNDWLWGGTIDDIHTTITHGIRNMPAYAQSIPTDDRWAIVSYVRALQLSEQGRPTRPE